MTGVLYIDTSFTKIVVKPVHPTFGAEVQVPDWNNLDDDAVREISSAANKVRSIVLYLPLPPPFILQPPQNYFLISS